MGSRLFSGVIRAAHGLSGNVSRPRMPTSHGVSLLPGRADYERRDDSSQRMNGRERRRGAGQ
jgi:hypothetical protein